jgi:hypothetical protein
MGKSKLEPPTVVNRWDEKAGLRRDAVGSRVIDVLEAQEKKMVEAAGVELISVLIRHMLLIL